MCENGKITVLNCGPKEYQRINKIRIRICVAVVLCVLAVNILCAVFMDEQNKAVMLTVNILTDIACGFFLVWFVTEKIIPRVKLLRLVRMQAETFGGRVEKISEETVRYLDFDCRQVHIDGRVFYQIDGGAVTFCVGDRVKIEAVSGVAVSVEKVDYE